MQYRVSMGMVPSNEPDLVQFSFRHFRIVHMDIEISQSRFSCFSKGTGFDPFQNSVAEIVESIFWPSGKESRNASFSPLKNIVSIDFLNQFLEVALSDHHRVIMPTSTIPH
jgi:hypothetical protein